MNNTRISIDDIIYTIYIYKYKQKRFEGLVTAKPNNRNVAFPATVFVGGHLN